ncbi:M protein trans-acting positive regulator PRD domain-containing protein [Helcococcus kunzii]|uniref:M protein trans-acting positive regulator PRD domain-containing protein n=1 Tax=Helcococcus kunzii TaxID=40091 RepID=UPI0024AD8783|nr:M protein trans-acting positive regulator PRD domain-containing protein [Helcococcus kunzii]
MREILNNAEQRRIKLVELMYFYGNSVDKNTMLSELKCKESSIRADIDYLNENFGNIFYLQMLNNKITLKYLKKASISNFFYEVLNISPIFNLVESVFFKKTKTINELSDQLFTSISTIYRMIEKLNIATKKNYDIYLDTKDLVFVGDENNIRSFFIQYFSEKYGFSNWPFDDNYYNNFVDLIKYIHEIAKIELIYCDLNSIMMVSMINLYRYKQGFLIKSKKDKVIPSKFYLSLIENPEHEKRIKQLTSKLNIPHDYRAYEEIFGFFMRDDFASSFDEIIHNSNNGNSFEKSLVKIMKFTYTLNIKYWIKLPNLDDLVVRLHNGCILFNTLPNSNSIFFDRNRLYTEKMYSRFPDFVTDVRQHLVEYIEELKGKSTEKEVDYLTYLFFTVWKDLIPQLYKRVRKIKVLVISRYNYFHSRSVQDQLKLFFDFFMDITLCEEESIDLEYLENSDYDLIISDYNLPENIDKEWIHIHGNHSIGDYKYIIDTIYKILDVMENNI